MFLTVEDGLILGPICWLFGKIFELMYKLIEIISNSIGIEYVNLSVCVILFTFFIRACLFPLNFKQQKSSKVMNFIQPEINKATKKYNNKTDQESLMKKQQETQKIQKKYGVSLTSGCLPSLIQLPVFYGLYRVIQNIPAYVGDMKDKYIYIVESMKSATFDTSKLQALGLENKASYIDVINAIATDSEGKVSTAVTAAGTMMNSVSDGTVANDKVIDVLDKISASDWNQILDVFKFADQGTTDQVVKYVDNFNHMNTFLFGLNIADAPGMKLTVALIVPILSAVLQFISSKISMSASKNNSNDPAAAQTNSMMNMMTYGMPLMSLFICINLPIAIGLYWIIGSVISIITQLIINNYYKKCDVDKVLEKCKEKAARKQARKEARHPGKKSFYERMMDAQNGNVSTDNSQSESINRMASSRLKTYNNPTVDEVKKTESNVHYKSGSIGSKANVMLQYQNKSNDKGGK
jgi:membrane protein insertase, yidC/oxa1 family